MQKPSLLATEQFDTVTASRKSRKRYGRPKEHDLSHPSLCIERVVLLLLTAINSPYRSLMHLEKALTFFIMSTDVSMRLS